MIGHPAPALFFSRSKKIFVLEKSRDSHDEQRKKKKKNVNKEAN